MTSERRTVTIVDAQQPVNFQLKYYLEGYFQPYFFNNSPQKTLALRALSGHGPTNHCLTITDEWGRKTPLAFDAPYEYGGSYYRADLAIPNGATDGRHLTQLRSSRCDTGVELSAPREVSFYVDSVSPTVDGITPTSGTQISAGSHQIRAIVKDDVALKWNEIKITLSDLTDQTTQILAATYNHSDKTVYSAAVTLPANHQFHATIGASDRAGNLGSGATAFSTGEATPPPPPTSRLVPFDFGEYCIGTWTVNLGVGICGGDNWAKNWGFLRVGGTGASAGEGLVGVAPGAFISMSGAGLELSSPSIATLTVSAIAEPIKGAGATLCLRFFRGEALLTQTCGNGSSPLTLSYALDSTSAVKVGVYLLADPLLVGSGNNGAKVATAETMLHRVTYSYSKAPS